MKNNLRYWLYWTQCKKKIPPNQFPPEFKKYYRQIQQQGFSNLGIANTHNLYKKCLNYFDTVPSEEGMIEMNSTSTNALAYDIYNALMEIHDKICACYQSYFQVCTIKIQKIVPHKNSPGSSFGFHTDDTPHGLSKVFIYLNDTYKDNGAFRTFNYKITKQLIQRGFLESSSPGSNRISAQKLVDNNLLNKLNILEGPKGTSLFFDNNLAHKGTFPIQGHRIHIVFEIMPSPKPLDFQHIQKACQRNITNANYFPINPFQPDHKEWSHLMI